MMVFQAMVCFILAFSLILLGILTLWKKTVTFHQCLFKRSVDVNRYTRYMGIIDIVFGAVYAISGAIRILTPAESTAPFYMILVLICYFV